MRETKSFAIVGGKVIIRIHDRVCETSGKLLASDIFKEALKITVTHLASRNSLLLDIFVKRELTQKDMELSIIRLSL